MSTGLPYVVAIDLEFNRPSRSIIQLGAVMADLHGGTIDSGFSCLVNPGEPLNPGVAERTGTSQEVIDRAPTIDDAYLQMGTWLKPYELLRSLTPLVWGADINSLLCNAVGLKSSDEDWYFSAKGNDVKQFFALVTMHPALFGLLARFKLESLFVGDLASSVAKFGLSFEGQSNHAMYRAANIFHLYRALLKPKGAEGAEGAKGADSADQPPNS